MVPGLVFGVILSHPLGIGAADYVSRRWSVLAVLFNYKLVNRILFHLLIVSVLHGCVPIVPYVVGTSIPPVPGYVISEIKKNPKLSVLAIPVWRFREGYVEEGQAQYFKTTIDTIYILETAQIANLHEVIPERLSYGLAGMVSGHGVDNYFVGLYLVSANGDVTLLLPKQESWDVILHGTITKDWKRDLITTFRDAEIKNVFKEEDGSFWKSRFTIPCEHYARTTGTPREWCKTDVAGFFPTQPVEINMSTESRKDIVRFIESIEAEPDTNGRSSWTQRDIY